MHLFRHLFGILTAGLVYFAALNGGWCIYAKAHAKPGQRVKYVKPPSCLMNSLFTTCWAIQMSHNGMYKPFRLRGIEGKHLGNITVGINDVETFPEWSYCVRECQFWNINELLRCKLKCRLCCRLLCCTLGAHMHTHTQHSYFLLSRT